MDSITTMTAKQYRLQQWTEQIQACRNRPAGMNVEEWCGKQGITKATYYYRLRRVREACLEGLRSGEMIPVSRELMAVCQGKEKESAPQGGLDLEWNIYIMTGYTNFRSGIDWLAALLEAKMGKIHMNRLPCTCSAEGGPTGLRVWSGTDGWLLLYKRLSAGNFQWLRSAEEVQALTPQRFRWLMEGLTLFPAGRCGR